MKLIAIITNPLNGYTLTANRQYIDSITLTSSYQLENTTLTNSY